MKGIALLGSTGSIGMNTLDVIARHPERFRVTVLAAYQNDEAMLAQCRAFHPEIVVMVDEKAAERLRVSLKSVDTEIQVRSGMSALEEVVQLPQVDDVMAAIVGAVGLRSTLAAVNAGKRLLLANKEALVMAGHLFTEAARRSGSVVLPVDSEHNAIFQCVSTQAASSTVSRIFLTASGGPFRHYPLTALSAVTPEQAWSHPVWKMGKKISIDCATMINKGLEVIEAHWLFNMPIEKIEILIHPQSTIHSLVEYVDGSLLAQLGCPDMRIPIAYTLAWPDRITTGVKPLNLLEIGRLEFEPLDHARYPCVPLAYAAIKAGGTSTTILNAANEVAVQAFCDGTIQFTDIPHVIEDTLSRVTAQKVVGIEDVLNADRLARQQAMEACLGETVWK